MNFPVICAFISCSSNIIWRNFFAKYLYLASYMQQCFQLTAYRCMLHIFQHFINCIFRIAV